MSDYERGYVYVLTNPAIPGLVKIGKTYSDDVASRSAQLYSTGVPLPFDIAFACRAARVDEIERAMHIAFAPNRVNPKREFFKMEAEQAIAILKLLHVEETTAETVSEETSVSRQEIEASQAYKARRPSLNFKEMGLEIGSVLTYGDHTVTISGDRKVIYDGTEMSLTAATRLIRGLPADYALQPTPFWNYGDRSLSEIYNETFGD